MKFFLDFPDLRARGHRHSRVTLWRKERARPPEFPRRTYLGERTVSWAEPVISAYEQAKAAGHDDVTATAIAERARPRVDALNMEATMTNS